MLLLSPFLWLSVFLIPHRAFSFSLLVTRRASSTALLRSNKFVLPRGSTAPAFPQVRQLQSLSTLSASSTGTAERSSAKATAVITPATIKKKQQYEHRQKITMDKDNQEEYPKFSELDHPRLHPGLLNNVLQNMKFERTTEIQAKTWSAAAAGTDVLGRARTGTGKTVSFLLPSLQRLLLNNKSNPWPRNTIHMLVLSPTRELAAQIDEQAEQLMKNIMAGGGSNKNKNNKQQQLSHQVIFGGASKPKDISRLERQIPTILTATPGRLRDHIQTTTLRSGISFADLLAQTEILVLDETDRLLDMGFRREVDDIISYLPSKQNRQTLLFSATVPPEVKAVMARTMKSDFVTVDCIHDADPATHTNAQVPQSHVILDSQTRLVTGTVDVLYSLIQKARTAREPLKLVAFFSTAHTVAYYAELFNDCLGIAVSELHSRKSQAHRTRVADAFRDASSAILFTSDVSARGVDYPGVTHVVQFGMADCRETYIHRLGRTGRAGQLGEGLLVLTDLEENFVTKTLKGLDVPVNTELQRLVDGQTSTDVMAKLDPMFASIQRDDSQSLASSARAAYRSMLGFYNGKLTKLMNGGRSSSRNSKNSNNNDSSYTPLVQFVNGFARQAGLPEVPELEQKMMRKMGLSGANIQGLNVVKNGTARDDKRNNNNNNGGRGRGGGGRGNNGGGRGAGGEQQQPGRGGGRGQQEQQQQQQNRRNASKASSVKRNNSVASELEAAPHQAKKAKPQGGGGRGGGGNRNTSNGRDDGAGASKNNNNGGEGRGGASKNNNNGGGGRGRTSGGGRSSNGRGGGRGNSRNRNNNNKAAAPSAS